MPQRSRTDYLVVHVTATPPHLDIGASEIRSMHMAKGWSDIGYHYVIRRDGTVEAGRPVLAVGAHVAGINSRSVGIALVGGVDAAGRPEHNATPAQMAALKKLLSDLTKSFPQATICGHRDLSPDKDGDGIIEPHEHLKACPCFDAIPWAAEHGLPPAPIKGDWSGSVPSSRIVVSAEEERTAYLQRLLARAGYSFGPVDGIMGPKTAAAITAFQTVNGLEPTGAFDMPTVSRLRQMFERKAA